MVSDIPSILVNGAFISAVYALIAIGFTMIFGVGNVLNLAHGALIMAGAYTYVLVGTDAFLPWIALQPALAVPLTILVVAVLSYGLYGVLVRHIEDNVVITFLSTIVVAITVTEVVIWYFSSQPRQYDLVAPYAAVPGAIRLQSVGVQFRTIRLVAFVASWIAIALLWYYVTRTDGGRSILATSMSERGARLTGVSIPAVRARTWLIAGALAGLAGVFLGNIQNASPTMWLNPLALAFIIVVIGGIGSIKGSIVAAYLVGYLETIVVNLDVQLGSVSVSLGPEFRGIFSLVVLLLVLLFMPQGLYGREFIHE